MSASEIGTPAGSPVNVATRHSPCDSPAVSNRSMECFMVATCCSNLVSGRPEPGTSPHLFSRKELPASTGDLREWLCRVYQSLNFLSLGRESCLCQRRPASL